MKKLPLLLSLVLSSMFTSCVSSADLLSDLIFGNRKSKKDKRAEAYEKRGFSKKKASRLAAEDEFWSNSKSIETPEEAARWKNPSYLD